MKVWITKYCLTMGIEEIEAEISSTNDELIRQLKNSVAEGYQVDATYYGRGKEWHTTKESAIEKANEIKEKKIKSLEKQIEKLKGLKFE